MYQTLQQQTYCGVIYGISIQTFLRQCLLTCFFVLFIWISLLLLVNSKNQNYLLSRILCFAALWHWLLIVQNFRNVHVFLCSCAYRGIHFTQATVYLYCRALFSQSCSHVWLVSGLHVGCYCRPGILVKLEVIYMYVYEQHVNVHTCTCRHLL